MSTVIESVCRSDVNRHRICVEVRGQLSWDVCGGERSTVRMCVEVRGQLCRGILALNLNLGSRAKTQVIGLGSKRLHLLSQCCWLCLSFVIREGERQMHAQKGNASQEVGAQMEWG